jgi:PAS domain S-box-containing protein
MRWFHCKGRRLRDESRMFGVILDITDRKKAEDALRESEQWLRAIVDTTPECMKLVGRDGTLLHMNESGLAMVGAESAEKVVGGSVYGLIAPEDRARFQEFNEKICRGARGSAEFDIVGLDGRRRHMETHAAPLRQADGTYAQLAVTRDVTERNLAHRAKSLLASIVDSSDDAIISKNLDGIITSWNAGAERLFRYSAAEAVGKPITIIIPPDRLGEETDILSRIRRGGKIDHYETVRMRKDGALLDISVTISPMRDPTGRVIGASKVARDVTERKRAEERERQITAEAVAATAKFRAVFEQTTVFAGIMSKDGRMIEANKMCLDACGYRAEEVIGLQFWETPWWRNFAESREKIRAATLLAAQGLPYREMLHYSWADGTERLVDFALYPILDDEGHILYLHPTGVDITDFKRAEENYRNLAETLDAEVQARTRELEERSADIVRQSEQLRELSWRLLRTQDDERRHVARELHDSAGQTLTVLGINVALFIQKAGRNAPELAADAEQIQESVQQLHREIRTTSYLLHPPLLDETGLFSALGWYVQGLAQRSGLHVSLDIPKDFGRLPGELELAVFRLVQECLTNIHRHSGSKSANIRIARDAEQIIVEVSDQGRGMSRARLAEIQSGGSGVGIRGMRERLRQFGGKLSIESDPSGTKILVAVPVPGTAAAEDENGIDSMQAAV